MKIHVKLSSTLRKHVAGYNPETGMDVEVEEGNTVSATDLANRLTIPQENIKFVMINGRYQPLQSELHPNDRVAFFPPVGGG